jgi:penicillin-binding protein 1A
MGITKDLVTGVWVGCDERSVHFRSSGTGEGAHTALPIFGRFMEKVYHDPSTGYTYGPFPKPTVDITREYNCQTIVIPTDTSFVDTMAVDSVVVPEETNDEPVDSVVKQQSNPTDSKPVTPAPDPQSGVNSEPQTRRERRQEARKQRRAEQQNN